MSFYTAEALVIARLADKTSARAVRPIGDLDELKKGSEGLPALLVLPNQLAVKTVSPGNSKAKYEEEILIVAMVKNARGGGSSPEALRLSAGALLLEAFQALAGWEPAKGFDALIPVTPPPAAIDGAFGYFPLAFRTAYIVSAP